MIARILVASIVSLMLAPTALAQPTDPSPGQLRSQARAALGEGRIEDAFGLMRDAAERSTTPSDWREVAEIAERLRLDALAVTAYETYLERSPQADDRAAIQGRLRVLRHLATGGRYTVAEGGGAVPELVDWNGEPVAAGPPGSVLVDWQGRPQARRSELFTLAEWDGTMQGPAAPVGVVHTPRGDASGFGRALAAP